MKFIDAALKYAARGHRLLPIKPRAKEPLVQHGVHDASADPRQIAAWWKRWPDANIAMAVPNHWRVIDCDPRNGGDVSDLGDLPPTVTAATGGGGAHLIYRTAPETVLRGKLCPGVDLLGPGRYFLIAPSIHPSGGIYRWTSAPGTKVAELPEWVAEMASKSEPAIAPSSPVGASSPITTSILDRARAYALKCGPAISGSGGHNQTFIVAQKLVRGFGLSEDAALTILMDWNTTCQPPWSLRDLKRKIHEAAIRGHHAIGDMADRPMENRR